MKDAEEEKLGEFRGNLKGLWVIWENSSWGRRLRGGGLGMEATNFPFFIEQSRGGYLPIMLRAGNLVLVLRLGFGR